MKMNSDDKFNVVIAFEVIALLCWSDLKSLIGVGIQVDGIMLRWEIGTLLSLMALPL